MHLHAPLRAPGSTRAAGHHNQDDRDDSDHHNHHETTTESSQRNTWKPPRHNTRRPFKSQDSGPGPKWFPEMYWRGSKARPNILPSHVVIGVQTFRSRHEANALIH